MTTTLEPLQDRIIVRPHVDDDPEKKTKGGIFIPAVAKEKPQEGECVAAGPGRWENGALVPMSVKVGDSVLYGRFSGTELEVDDEPVLVLRESDVLAVVRRG